MMRCSPTGHDDGYTVLPATWQTVLVSKLGELLFPNGISNLSRGRSRLEGLGSLYAFTVDRQR